jgi:hypothetical protein
MRPRPIIAIALSVLAFAAFGTAPAQAAPTSTVDVFWTSLVARGAAVDVAYAVDCPDGVTGTVDVALTQLRDDGLTASGTSTEALDCGAPGLQRVTASVTGAPFTRGRATLTMLVSGCDDQGCFTVPLSRNTRLTA